VRDTDASDKNCGKCGTRVHRGQTCDTDSALRDMLCNACASTPQRSAQRGACGQRCNPGEMCDQGQCGKAAAATH